MAIIIFETYDYLQEKADNGSAEHLLSIAEKSTES